MHTHMLVLADVVPGLVHISLFLFLAGLADSLLNAYTTVGRSTLFAIVLCVTLYIVITVAPVIEPQSSYRTPCSPLVWYITRKLWIRTIIGRFACGALPLSPNMAGGQMQLAMEKSEARISRDIGQINGWSGPSLPTSRAQSHSYL